MTQLLAFLNLLRFYLTAHFSKVGTYSPPSLDGLTHLNSSGYVRLGNSDAVVFLDVADVGASYLPGHGHADALALEFSLFRQRLFVNIGTSEYGNGTRRRYERSTPPIQQWRLRVKILLKFGLDSGWVVELSEKCYIF